MCVCVLFLFCGRPLFISDLFGVSLFYVASFLSFFSVLSVLLFLLVLNPFFSPLSPFSPFSLSPSSSSFSSACFVFQPPLPEEWFCDSCNSHVKDCNRKCRYCVVAGGALKPLSSSAAQLACLPLHAHPACARELEGGMVVDEAGCIDPQAHSVAENTELGNGTVLQFGWTAGTAKEAADARASGPSTLGQLGSLPVSSPPPLSVRKKSPKANSNANSLSPEGLPTKACSVCTQKKGLLVRCRAGETVEVGDQIVPVMMLSSTGGR